MSLQDLIDEEPPASVRVQTNPGRKDAAAIPLHQLRKDRETRGRACNASAHQRMMWYSLGIECQYEFITLDGTLENGEFVLFDDGRLFRVTGVGQKRYEKGGIETHYKYPMVEVRVL